MTDVASMAYFKKIGEDNSTIRYQFGPSADELNSEITVDKVSSRIVDDAESLGHTGRKAASKILQLYRERGAWPERGGSYS